MRKRRSMVFRRMVLSFLAAALWLGVAYQYGCVCQAQPEGDCIQTCGWWCCLLRDHNAVITAFGIFIGVAGFWFISIQIEQGQKGLKQAKRSVDAFIEVERGRLSFLGGGFDDPPQRVSFKFKNTGKGRVRLSAMGIRFVDSDNAPPVFGKPSISVSSNDSIAPDDIVDSTTPLSGMTMASSFNVGNLPKAIRDRIASGKAVFVQVFVQYRPELGNRQYEVRHTYNYIPGDGIWDYAGEGCWGEYRIKRGIFDR